MYGRGGGCDEGSDPLPVFGGGRGGIEVPLQVGLFAVEDFEFLDHEAGLLAKRAPLARRDEAIVAGVAEFFDLMEPCFGFGGIIGDRGVDHEEPAASLEDACAFADEIGGRGEMVGGDTTGDELEGGVGIREGLGGVLVRAEFEAPLGGSFSNALEHGGGQIGGGDTKTRGSKIKRRMAGAGGDVDGFGTRREMDVCKGGGNVAGVLEDVPTGVAMALFLELLLGGALDEVHGEF